MTNLSLNNNHKYGIILPVKNGGHHVKECVNGILSQTYDKFNLIVLDNCSTDGTLQWISQLNDNRIVIHKAAQPLGITGNWARIAGIEKNEFITLIGHDDVLHPDYLAVMNALIDKYPEASLYQTHFKFIDEAGDDVRPCRPMNEIQSAAEFLTAQMTRKIDSTGTGYMMRSKDYDALGGISARYPNLIFADYELWVQLILKSYKATAQTECFSYRLHKSVSNLTNGDDFQQAFGEYVHFLATLKDKDPGIKAVIELHGKEFLMYYCQSLSHRLLRTSRQKRKTTVKAYIEKCRGYARLLIPGQSFRPMAKPKILAAYLLDNAIGLKLFGLYKRMQAK